MSRQLTSGVLGRKKVEYAVDFSGGTISGFLMSSGVNWDLDYEVEIHLTLDTVSTTQYFLGDSTNGTIGVRYNGSNFLVRFAGTFTTLNYTAESGFLKLRLLRSSLTQMQIYINDSLIGTAGYSNADVFNIKSIGYYVFSELNYTGKIKYLSIKNDLGLKVREFLFNEGSGTTLNCNVSSTTAEWEERDGSSPIWEKL
jgi:hypothetical protein